MEELFIEAYDGLKLSFLLKDVDNPRGVCMIMHGMCEHKERYEELIHVLALNNIASICPDMRGHGKSINDKYPYGHPGTIENIVSDYHQIAQFIQTRYPSAPFYIFAHSMGTLNARMFLQKYDAEVKKLVLSGTVCYNGGAGLGVFMAKRRCMGQKAYEHSETLFAMTNGFSKKVDFSWLSYNEDNIKAYIDDPLSGFPFTNRGYLTLFEEIKELKAKKHYACVNPNLPILSLSGIDDRTTGGKKGLKGIKKLLNRIGYKNVEVKEYPHMKHEILNEKDNDCVYEDIIKFYD